MGTETLDAHDRARLRWRARRGLLENDLLLTRYLDANEKTMTDADVFGLKCLLELGDNDLMDLLLGRTQLSGALDRPEVRHVLDQVRVA
ncbi:succinate dehydrogenase assembly factor 2 [Orrella sp. 11846]|uniref:FAD assembly factor SdhE n=1 Tax=Orrella sp. 11846 TaxID=3409913 RepID=UPI003B5CAD8B